MDNTIDQHAVKAYSHNWYQAMTLSERIPLLRHDLLEKIPSTSTNKRFESWQQSFVQREIPFTDRLEMDGLTETSLQQILAMTSQELAEVGSYAADWIERIMEAFSERASNTKFFESEAYIDRLEQFFSNRTSGQIQNVMGFVNLVTPLLALGRRRLIQRATAELTNYSSPPFDPTAIVEMSFVSLLTRLVEPTLLRTMVLELNVARLQGRLNGVSNEAGFESFVNLLRQPEFSLDLLYEYPVMARQVVQCIYQWVEVNLELMIRLAADWSSILSLFCPDQDPGPLVELKCDAGDRHRHGRSVHILVFASGFRLVYKPRSIQVDQKFQELLAWMNQHGDHPPFHLLKMLTREQYGWIEFVEHGPCTSDSELRNFYRRQGGYLALLYALGAVDFHLENLIASGEHPVLIDVESLFHPTVGGGKTRASDVDAMLGSKMEHSVIRVGLLPQRVWGNNATEGIDLSGLGGIAGQLSPHPVPTYEDVGKDVMRFTRKRVTMPGSSNRPTLSGQEVAVQDYVSDIRDGFIEIYQFLLRHREAMTTEGGVLQKFADVEVRIILRPTQTYHLLYYESFHPDLLRDALDRECLFDRLWFSAKPYPFLTRVIAAEREDLWQGDTPIFSTHPNSRDLWTSSGKKITDFFEETGMEMVLARFNHLSEDDLTQQLWFIEASLATLAMGVDHAHWRTYEAKITEQRASQKELLVAAEQIGQRLALLALDGKNGASWFGLTLMNERNWMLAPVGADLYNGLPGIVLFLAYLGKSTHNHTYTQLAQDGLKTLQTLIEQLSPRLQGIGAYDGWGGWIYTLTHLGILWQQPALLDQAEWAVQRLPDLIKLDQNFDIIGGSAGCIGALLTLYRVRPSAAILEVATYAGDHLLQQATRTKDGGLGWPSTASSKPLAGFSHGASGIAWALIELEAITHQPRFSQAAFEALHYERTLFSSKNNNWADLREIPDEQLGNLDLAYFMTAWCHGAPGIGLSRVAMLKYYDTPELRADLAAAIQNTLQHFGQNHSLCHGDLGNLDLIFQVSLEIDPQLRTKVYEIAHAILDSIAHNGWLCGVPSSVETPSLMTGLAGIGYELLRLASLESLPSFLILEPPQMI
ncbi:MAG: type 2 lantipeptide synthetase LanM [Chloroflexi bacterium]|nr:type 2 lantipeptide synthetase LanM [Chloroflexota bacterium]